MQIENIKFQLKELRVLLKIPSFRKIFRCQNESNPDDNRISEIQQGIDIEKELFLINSNKIANLEDEKKLIVQLSESTS
ncbi:14983_t:CDS:1, partial [Gigaspora margarita]